MMKNEILDEIEETIEIGGPPIYATKSFNQFIFAILIMVFYNLLMSHSGFIFYGKSILEYSVDAIFGVVLLVVSIMGMRNAAKSETYQESSWKKYVGAVGNMLLFFPFAIFFLINFFELLSGLSIV